MCVHCILFALHLIDAFIQRNLWRLVYPYLLFSGCGVMAEIIMSVFMDNVREKEEADTKKVLLFCLLCDV